VPTEFLLFPGEGHELSRSGRPRHRLARFEHVLRWWARWLPTPANPGVEAADGEVQPVADGPVVEEEPAVEPLTLRATRVV
jgi:hypothetical protein